MSKQNLTLAIVLPLAIFISTTVVGQQSQPQSDVRGKASANISDSRNEANQLAKERRGFAVQVVSSLADDARNYKDESLRAKVQARAASVLWKVEPGRARILFDRAWDAAESVDKEGRRRSEEERKRFLTGRGGIGFIPPPPNLRAEVLRLASQCDRSLAEKYLKKMDEEDKREQEENGTKRRWDPTEPPEAITKRLQLARQLLENGQIDGAAILAQSAMSEVTSDGIIFLVLLRQKKSAMADQIFTSLLDSAAREPRADATSVSLLSAYVLTPSVLVTFTQNGLLVNPWTAMLPPPQLAPGLRLKFVSVAGQILLRPLSPAELESTSAGIAGTYFTITRLMPYFEQSLPALASALQNRLNQLAQGREELIPPQQRSFVNAGFETTGKGEEEPDDTLSKIERASTTRERDQLYAVAAERAASKDDLRAREFADKIEDEGLRNIVRNFVDVVLIRKAIEKRDPEKARQLTAVAQLSHFQRVWSYTEIAALLNPASQQDADSLITQAISEAEHIEATNPESAEAWVAIAANAIALDPARKAGMLLDVVRAVNKTENYTGEEDSFSVDFRSRNNITKVTVPAPKISLANLFSLMAKDDIHQAADIAQSIKTESPRAIALLASARAVLEMKPRAN